jgi:hypothetical protein
MKFEAAVHRSELRGHILHLREHILHSTWTMKFEAAMHRSVITNCEKVPKKSLSQHISDA